MISLLRPDETVVAPRLRLSQARPVDLEGMSSWLIGALAPEWEAADLEGAVAAGAGILVSDRDGAAIGVAVVLTDTPRPRCATLPFLAVDPARRFRGLGGEAGIALERHLRAAGFDKVYAPVPDGRGLAVYFWLRLGFRPLTRSEWPGPLIGLSGKTYDGIWMLRDA